MSQMKDVKAIVRTDCVQDLIERLQGADVPRFYVSHVHVLGSGVDPEDLRVSFEEGGSYTEKAKVEFLCRAERIDELLEVIRGCACTGHRGDGMVIVSNVTDILNIRTGDHDRIALL